MISMTHVYNAAMRTDEAKDITEVSADWVTFNPFAMVILFFFSRSVYQAFLWLVFVARILKFCFSMSRYTVSLSYS